jgi:nitroreductase
MELMKVIRTRRSARSFKPDAISEAILAEILEAGRLAPSLGNAQGWYFGVVKDEQVKQQLAQAAGNQTWIATAPLVIALCANINWHLQPPAEDDFGLVVCLTRYGADFWNYLHCYPIARRIGAL